MKILALDDEFLGLEGLCSTIKEVEPNAELHSFQDATEALEDASTWIPDIAFLDIEMRTDNGIDVAIKLKDINPQINIIFVTGYSDYMKQAFSIYASGYVLKPVLPEQIHQELEHLRYPILEKKRIYIHTFGDFEIFGDGKPINFAYSKSKELLAILIDAQGITCNMAKIEDLLWENDYNDHRAYIRNLIADIRRTLRKFDSEDLIIRSHNQIAIDASKIECDYFEYLKKNPQALKAFNGEYMNQYSWAESTLGNLLRNPE